MKEGLHLTVDEFKRQFKAFSFSDDDSITDINSPSIIDVEYLKELLEEKTLEVQNKLLSTKEIPTFSIKQYILFSVASVFTANYAANSDLINYIREKEKEYRELFNASSNSLEDRSYDSVSLEGDVPKQ